MENKSEINDINSVERCAIKICLDCFILVKRRKYTDKRLKVDYQEMLKMNASSEVVLERSASLVMDEEEKTQVEGMEVEMANDVGEAEESTMDLDEQASTYKTLNDLEWRHLKRRTQNIYELVEKAALKKTYRLIGSLVCC